MKEIKLIYNNVYSLIAKGKIFAKRNVYINYKTSLFKKKNFYILNSSNSKIKIVYQTRNKNSSLIFEKNALKLLNPKIISNYHIKDIIFTSIHAGLLYNLMVDDKIQINSNNMLTNYLAIGYNNDFHLCFYKEIFSSFIHSIHYKLFTKNNSNNTYFSELISTKLDYRKNKNYYLNVKKKIKSKYDHISTRYSLNYANKYSSCNSRFFFNEDLAEVKNICCLFNYVFISNSISINKEISDINYLFNQHYFNLNYSTNIKKLKSKSLSLINNYFYKRIVKKRFLYLKDCFNINELIFDKLLLKIDSEGNRVIDISDYNFAGFGLSTKNFTEYKNKKINNSQSTLKNITTTLDNISDYLFNDLIKEIQIYLQGCYFINNCSNNNRLRLLISNYNNFINLNLSIKNQFHNTSMLSLSNNYWYQQNTKLPSYLDDIDINPLCFQLNLSFYLKNKEVRFIKSKTKQFTSIYVKSIKSIVYRPYSNLYEPTLKYISNLSEKFLHIFINSRSLMKNIKSNLLLNFYLSQAMCSTHIKGNERYKKRYFIMDYKRVPLLINLVHTIKYQENRRTSY
uniref:Uncharacterized protein n=1 Tax=Amorphochlora amoebiformis TaxID=1561963 RepID=A0A0H5BKT0_9EUKA|nr:hypothetical protein [Amorphochlora amoebiformis]